MSMEDYNFNKARQAWGEQPKQGMNMNEQQRIVGREAIAGGIVGGTIAGADMYETKQDPPIAAEMNQLDKNLAILQDYIIQLESRLAPVLQEIPPASQEKERLAKGPRGSSALSGGLRSLNNHVMNLQDRIVDIRERVEV
jgi:hypothetical protein